MLDSMYHPETAGRLAQAEFQDDKEAECSSSNDLPALIVDSTSDAMSSEESYAGSIPYI